MIDLSKCTDQELKEELQKRGYCTSSLWSDEDVTQNIDRLNEHYGTDFKMSIKECIDILDQVFGKDADKTQGNEAIADYLYDHFDIYELIENQTN